MSSSPTEPVAVTMPQMGVSVVEGTLALWHKRVGDRVESEETICEISTDKIDTDVPSPAAGRVAALLVSEGETVAVGAVLARIEVDAPAAGDLEGDAGGPVSGGAAAARARSSGAPAASRGGPAPSPGEPAPSSAAAPGDAPGEAQAAGAAGASGPRPPAGRAGAIYSPVVQRIAAEHGIDLERVRGTGRDGRVRKQDVLAHVEAVATTPASELSEPPGEPPDEQPGEPPDVQPGGSVAQPLSRMRRAIAEHMTRSLRTAAHCTTIIEVDMSRVEAARAEARLSPLPYVARCAVESLGAFGRLNATLEGEVLTRYGDVDLGVAVSLGERGLIVPVIRRAQDRSVSGLAAEIRALARRARADELRPDEVRGATFTITNPGRLGTIGATPIINQPQVAILDLEAVVLRPVVVGGDSIAIRPIANLCLSWDHRALDGLMAAEFLADLRARIESWGR